MYKVTQLKTADLILLSNPGILLGKQELLRLEPIALASPSCKIPSLVQRHIEGYIHRSYLEVYHTPHFFFFKEVVTHLRETLPAFLLACQAYHTQKVTKPTCAMNLEHVLNLERLLEIEIEKKQLEIDKKQCKIDEKQFMINRKQHEINYARDQLLFQRREREALEAVARGDGNIFLEQPQVGDLSKTSLGEDQVKETAEGLTSNGILDQPSSIKLRTESLTPQPRHASSIATVPAAADSKSIQAEDDIEKDMISTSHRTPPQSLIVKLKLPTRCRQAISIEKMTQKGISKMVTRITKPPTKQSQSNTKPKRRTARVIEEELLLEVSELDSNNLDRLPKRERPPVGSYKVPSVLDDSEKRELLARFCNPIIQIFRNALKGITTSNSQLSRGFDVLQQRLDDGTLDPDDGFSEWVHDMEQIIQLPGLRHGTDREMLVSKLQRWSEEWDQCLSSYVFEPHWAHEGFEAINHLVEKLTLEFSSLSEDVIPIVRSDVI